MQRIKTRLFVRRVHPIKDIKLSGEIILTVCKSRAADDCIIMSYLPKHYLYMPPGSYTILPKGAFEKDIEKMDSERYARLSNANVIFWQPISKELRQRFIEEYEVLQQHLDPNGFE